MRQTSMAIRAVASFLYGPRSRPDRGSWNQSWSLHDTVATADTGDPAKPRQSSREATVDKGSRPPRRERRFESRRGQCPH